MLGGRCHGRVPHGLESVSRKQLELEEGDSSHTPFAHLTPSFLVDRIIARTEQLTVVAGEFCPSTYFPRMLVLLRTQAVSFFLMWRAVH